MLFSAFLNTVIRLRRNRSSVLIVRRFYVITRTKRRLQEALRMTASSNVFRKPPKFCSTLSNAGNMTQ